MIGEMDSEQSPRHSKRPRVLVACQRCKGRRQKCDNASPACSNCSRANVTCTYSPNAYPSSYVKQLEERIGTLEARLNHTETNQSTELQPTSRNNPEPPVDSLTSRRRREAPVRPSSGHLASGLGLLSSCAAAEPHYFGFSSGLSLAHFVQNAIDAGTSFAAEVSLPSLADRPFSSLVPTSLTTPAPLPSKPIGSRFVKAYLSMIHPLYPFLDKTKLWDIHQHPPKQDSAPTMDSQLDLAVLHLVYAIGSRCLQLLNSSKIGKDISEGHFVAAMKAVPEAMKFTSIRSIEITLLLALHSMRSPSGTSVWHLCGLAMRQCLELGLHKQRVVDDSQLALDQIRKRLFWSVYIFERKTALVVGRPFAVSEKEIDTEIPLNVNDDETDTAVFSAARRKQLNGDSDDIMRSSMSLHRHHILLYHIHTKIRYTLHRLKKVNPPGKLEKKLTRLFEELDKWKQNVTTDYTHNTTVHMQNSAMRDLEDGDSSSGSESSESVRFKRSAETEKTELMLEYHKARRSLLQPLMTEVQNHYFFGLTEYNRCAESSGQICQLYRRLHRLSSVPFTLRDLHAIFVAGFTLVYCICAKPTLYNATRAADIGACSTVLYVITEQWPSARKYRDAFETVVEKMVERTTTTAEIQADRHQTQRLSEILEGPSVQQIQMSIHHNPKSQRQSKHQSRHLSKRKVNRGHGIEDSRIYPSGVSANQANNEGTDLNEDGYGPESDNMYEQMSNVTSSPVAERGYDYAAGSHHNLDNNIGLDLNFDEIGGILNDEGMDWFSGAVMWN